MHRKLGTGLPGGHGKVEAHPDQVGFVLRFIMNLASLDWEGMLKGAVGGGSTGKMGRIPPVSGMHPAWCSG